MTTNDAREGADALAALRWRDELLGVLFWLRGEQIMSSASVDDLVPFLVAEADTVREQLEGLVAEGFLERSGAGLDARYSLSNVGGQAAGRVFADDFAELTGAAHGECGPGCSCQRHGAASCKIPAA